MVYRPGLMYLALGLLFFAVGATFSGAGFYYLLTGTPPPMSTETGPSRPGTIQETWMIALFPLIHTGVGLAMMLYAINAKIVLTMEGVVGTNVLGRERFRAQWSELAYVKEESGSEGGTVYTLFTVDGRKARLPDRHVDELLPELRNRAPALMNR